MFDECAAASRPLQFGKAPTPGKTRRSARSGPPAPSPDRRQSAPLAASSAPPATSAIADAVIDHGHALRAHDAVLASGLDPPPPPPSQTTVALHAYSPLVHLLATRRLRPAPRAPPREMGRALLASPLAMTARDRRRYRARHGYSEPLRVPSWSIESRGSRRHPTPPPLLPGHDGRVRYSRAVSLRGLHEPSAAALRLVDSTMHSDP